MTVLTSGYVDLSIGTATRSALAPTTAAFAQYERQAVAVVQSRAAVAGYTVSSTSTNDHVKLLVLGQWYLHAIGFRQGIELPPMVAQQITDLERVSSGQLPIAGLTPAAEDAVGGVTFSSALDYPARFDRDGLKVW